MHIGLSFVMLFYASAMAAANPVRSGQAEVQWIAQTLGYTPGKPIVTGFKMSLDPCWHTYWINPGEAGMPLAVDLNLPDGWSADEPLHPVPGRFKTGELSDFGYENSVIFPIIIHPPASASVDVEIKATFSWLTCNDSACVPGDATLTLPLKAGDNSPTTAAGEIAKALAATPAPAGNEWTLHVDAAGEDLALRLTMPPSVKPGEIDVFPLPANIAHPAATYTWTAEDGAWHARVAKSAYAPDTIDHFELVIQAPPPGRPVLVGWSAE